MKKIRYISIFVVFLTFYLCVYAAQYYRVNNNASQVINEHSKRYIVENKTGNDIFIPTNTSTEWQSFIDNKPANVSLYTSSRNTGGWGSCSKTCGPGTKTRTVTCKRSDGTTIADSFCSGTKPGTSETCNNGACAPVECTGVGSNCKGGIQVTSNLVIYNGYFRNNWPNSNNYCNNLVSNGYTDWRLPTVNEIKNIANNKILNNPFGQGELYLWSSEEFYNCKVGSSSKHGGMPAKCYKIVGAQSGLDSQTEYREYVFFVCTRTF